MTLYLRYLLHCVILLFLVVAAVVTVSLGQLWHRSQSFTSPDNDHCLQLVGRVVASIFHRGRSPFGE